MDKYGTLVQLKGNERNRKVHSVFPARTATPLYPLRQKIEFAVRPPCFTPFIRTLVGHYSDQMTAQDI
jgi:hypothetical protein